MYPKIYVILKKHKKEIGWEIGGMAYSQDESDDQYDWHLSQGWKSNQLLKTIYTLSLKAEVM